MTEENNQKSNWTRIFRKKWFFPAVYLGLAALLLTVIVWYQNMDNQVPEIADDQEEETNNYSPDPFEEDANPVVEQGENITKPVTESEQVEIVTKFYDSEKADEEKQQALVHHNKTWYQSTGVDFASESGDSFDVTASMSGDVSEIKDDPLLGNVVTLSHGNDVKTFYASLGDVQVEKGDKLDQGDVLGTAGKSLFGQDKGKHVHFELQKGEMTYDPEEYFNQPVSKMDEQSSEKASSDESQTDSETDMDDEKTEDDSDAEDKSSDSEMPGNSNSEEDKDSDSEMPGNDGSNSDMPDESSDHSSNDSDK